MKTLHNVLSPVAHPGSTVTKTSKIDFPIDKMFNTKFYHQVNPALLYNHVMFIVLYLTGFFLEKKPCTICSLVSFNLSLDFPIQFDLQVFIVAMVLICYSGYDSCLFWSFCNHQVWKDDRNSTWKTGDIFQDVDVEYSCDAPQQLDQ